MQISDGKSEREKFKTTERLETAMFELLCEKSFGEISVTELCDRAHVARKTFYRKYRSMNEIIEIAFSKVFEHLATEIGFVDADVDGIYLFCYEFLAKHRSFTAAFVDPSLHKTVVDMLVGFIESAFEKTFYDTVTREPIESEFVAPFIAEGLISIISTWVAGGFKLTPEQLARLSERLLSGVLV